jgi:hypothetical protein|tara:strand:+ start:319 stop:555 length:237 start_codon:yes stop_codon:yes gene_type:complete
LKEIRESTGGKGQLLQLLKTTNQNVKLKMLFLFKKSFHGRNNFLSHNFILRDSLSVGVKIYWRESRRMDVKVNDFFKE